jgi:Na+/H+-dicarboxylate symporter
VVILLVLMLTSKGSAGVSGAGFVTLVAMNVIPVAGIVLILGVDRFVNPPRAMLNVIGNSLGTIVVAQNGRMRSTAAAPAALWRGVSSLGRDGFRSSRRLLTRGGF